MEYYRSGIELTYKFNNQMQNLLQLFLFANHFEEDNLLCCNKNRIFTVIH